MGRASSRAAKRSVRNRNLPPDFSLPSSDDSTNSDESTTLCAIGHLREPEPFTQRSVGHKIDPLDWVCCDQCLEWHHCYCADVEFESVSTTATVLMWNLRVYLPFLSYATNVLQTKG